MEPPHWTQYSLDTVPAGELRELARVGALLAYWQQMDPRYRPVLYALAEFFAGNDASAELAPEFDPEDELHRAAAYFAWVKQVDTADSSVPPAPPPHNVRPFRRPPAPASDDG